MLHPSLEEEEELSEFSSMTVLPGQRVELTLAKRAVDDGGEGGLGFSEEDQCSDDVSQEEDDPVEWEENEEGEVEDEVESKKRTLPVGRRRNKRRRKSKTGRRKTMDCRSLALQVSVFLLLLLLLLSCCCCCV